MGIDASEICQARMPDLREHCAQPLRRKLFTARVNGFWREPDKPSIPSCACNFEGSFCGFYHDCG
jgi:hypothetical protein